MPTYWTPPTLTAMRSWLERQYPGGAFSRMGYKQMYAIYKQRGKILNREIDNRMLNNNPIFINKGGITK